MNMNPENPYHKEALVAGLAKAVNDFQVVCAEHGFPATDESRTAFCVEILAEWGIEKNHMESIINAAVAKAGDAQ